MIRYYNSKTIVKYHSEEGIIETTYVVSEEGKLYLETVFTDEVTGQNKSEIKRNLYTDEIRDTLLDYLNYSKSGSKEIWKL